jgi:hypothetical protein
MSCADTCVHSKWVDRYLTRRMDDTMTATFEEHLLECRPCLEALEFERHWRGQDLTSLTTFVSRTWH